MARLRTLFFFLLWTIGAAGPSSAEPAPATTDRERLARAAIEQTNETVIYDGSYVVLDYPGGDVPRDRGVCTDVLIRAYRAIGLDLQVLVHEDMRANFSAYPDNWGLDRPDRNIDHRRVPNLATFFSRHGEVLQISAQGADYAVGDIVTWTVGRSLPHIGIVTAERSEDGERPLIVHNIGQGPRLEDMLFEFPITGHYRYPQGAP